VRDILPGPLLAGSHRCQTCCYCHWNCKPWRLSDTYIKSETLALLDPHVYVLFCAIYIEPLIQANANLSSIRRTAPASDIAAAITALRSQASGSPRTHPHESHLPPLFPLLPKNIVSLLETI